MKINPWQGPFPIGAGWALGEDGEGGYVLTHVGIDGVADHRITLSEGSQYDDDPYMSAMHALCWEAMRNVKLAVDGYGRKAKPSITWVPETLRVLADAIERGEQ
jgi:hypothetical protein